jgi:enediyne biosynthesis protein E4
LSSGSGGSAVAPRQSPDRGSRLFFSIGLAVILIAACSDTADVLPTDGGGAQARDWFEDKAKEAGLEFVYVNGMAGKFYLPEIMPAGVGLLDYDNDGDLDIFLTQGRAEGPLHSRGGSRTPPGSAQLTARLFRNDLQPASDAGPVPRFTDVTERAGIEARGYGMGVAAGDFDNDGCVDLYLTNFGPNVLLRNQCNGTFTDVSKSSGTDHAGWSVSASFVDYDRDGWLDLYVGNYVHVNLAADRTCTGLTGKRTYCPPAEYRPESDRLYRNNRNGTFSDVTTRALKGGPFGPALGVVSADFNNDGWIDIYVANDGRENLLWINQGDGTLRNMGLLSGAALSGDGKPEGSMGVDAGDFDDDGDEDLFMTHLPSEGNNLYVNNGTGLFDDMSASSGLGPSSLGHTGFGTAWFDFDNDGRLDILAVNGAVDVIRDREADAFPFDERKLLFRNIGRGLFEDVSQHAGAAFRSTAVGRGAAFGDVDNDGDVDVLVGNINGPAQLLINTVGNRQHWIGLRLVGKTARDMLGARVRVIGKDGQGPWRRARTDGSYASANDPRVLIGLGAATDTPTVRVRWPGNDVEEWASVPIDRWTTLTQGQGAAR